MRWWILIAIVGAASPARADWMADVGLDMGTLIGHGPLSERLDPITSATARLAIRHDAWLVDGGLLVFGSYSDASLEAIGLTGSIRHYGGASVVGDSYVAIGASRLALEDSSGPMPMHAGRAFGPKLSVGLEWGMTAGSRHVAVGLAATYHYLMARLDDGTSRTGGFAGIEFTLLNGAGTHDSRR